ncbi:DUF3019 domain-containing protein [Pseudoalteromonas pernae]|uniref:DUF3019 domain-containing protein n=1 Tax=Pseudoalteromonas pernae TaxID=3118054 RepID=UPI00324298AC
MLIDYFVALALIPSTMQDNVAPVLDVTPHTCIQENEATRCKMEVHVSASSSAHHTLCIVLDLPKVQRECFVGNRVKTTYSLTLETTTNISLRSESGEILAQKKLTVGKLTSKNYRVRRRFGWGI